MWKSFTRRCVNLAFPNGSWWFLPIPWFPPCSNITPSAVDTAVTRSVFNMHMYIHIYIYIYIYICIYVSIRIYICTSSQVCYKVVQIQLLYQVVSAFLFARFRSRELARQKLSRECGMAWDKRRCVTSSPHHTPIENLIRKADMSKKWTMKATITHEGHNYSCENHLRAGV